VYPGESDVTVGFTFAIAKAEAGEYLVARRVGIRVYGDLVKILSQGSDQAKLIFGVWIKGEGRESPVTILCVMNNLSDRRLQAVIAAIRI
jgi:hypothetical protein